MLRHNNKQNHRRSIGLEGGHPEKCSDIADSTSPEPDISERQSPHDLSLQPITPERSGLLNNNAANTANTTSTSKGPARSTIWRRAQKEKEKEKERQRRVEQQQNEDNAEENWEDIERLVEEKWPMVSKEIRATVLKRGMIDLNLLSNL